MFAHNNLIGETILRSRIIILYVLLCVVKRETYNPFLKVFNTLHELSFYLIMVCIILINYSLSMCVMHNTKVGFEGNSLNSLFKINLV